MTFTEAKTYRLPFGKYKGENLDFIGTSDEGLRYLDWLRDQDWLRADHRDAVEAYLGDPAIEKELEEL